MNGETNKKFSLQARTCIKGEAFFESLITDYAIPHHIVGQKDIGIDYICEWVHGDDPTGVLFAAQIKAFTITAATEPRPMVVAKNLNGLDHYTIANSNLTVPPETLRYWKGLGLPMYLFAVARTPAGEHGHDTLDCYYKRFTPVLTLDEPQETLCYYKVNQGAKFIAFAQEPEQRLGFARDLYIDLMRWAYYKGSIAYLNPHKMGLMQFGEEEKVFKDLFGNYKDRVCATFAKTKRFLEANCPDAIAGTG